MLNLTSSPNLNCRVLFFNSSSTTRCLQYRLASVRLMTERVAPVSITAPRKFLVSGGLGGGLGLPASNGQTKSPPLHQTRRARGRRIAHKGRHMRHDPCNLARRITLRAKRPRQKLHPSLHQSHITHVKLILPIARVL
jgi:hypothetical protein